MLSKLFNRTATFKQARSFSNSVYLWAQMPRLGPKAASVRQSMQLQKGKPQRIEFYDDLNVKTLRIGLRHSAVISEDGALYMFGTGNWGVLGQGNENDVAHLKPVQVTKFEKLGLKVKDVCVGESHTVALTEDGNVWTWGYAGKKGMFNWMYTQEVGALGHGDKESMFMPKRVEYFVENNIKIKEISAGLHHCNAITTDGQLYSWGRGLYGVLGNGSNDYSLLPQLNDSMEGVKDEASPPSTIAKMESSDEMSCVLMSDGQLNAWGKNDRGQLGTAVGIGIDMVESENLPTTINVLDENDVPQAVKDFTIGQNTMMIQDTNNDIYQVGLRLHYEPKKLMFDPAVLDTNSVKMLACGRKHYIIVTDSNDLLIWGSVISGDSSALSSEGYTLYSGEELFDGGSIEQLEVKYSIYGALVKH